MRILFETNLQTKNNIVYFYGEDDIVLSELLQEMYKRFREMFPYNEILLCTGEKFINEFIESIRQGKTIEFREKYRSAEILLIDEIQYFEGKKSGTEELYHTLKEMYINGKQIVITSDVKPTKLTAIDKRVKNLISKGLVFEVKDDVTFSDI